MKAASWHGRLALFYGPLQRYDLQDIDICTYTRAVLRGTLNAFGVIIGLTIVGLMAMSTLFNIYFLLVWDFNLQRLQNDAFAAMGIAIPVLVIGVGLMFAWYYVSRGISNLRAKHHKRKREAGFIEQAADAKLNHMCFKLDFSDVPRPVSRSVPDFDSRF